MNERHQDSGIPDQLPHSFPGAVNVPKRKAPAHLPSRPGKRQRKAEENPAQSANSSSLTHPEPRSDSIWKTNEDRRRLSRARTTEVPTNNARTRMHARGTGEEDRANNPTGTQLEPVTRPTGASPTKARLSSDTSQGPAYIVPAAAQPEVEAFRQVRDFVTNSLTGRRAGLFTPGRSAAGKIPWLKKPLDLMSTLISQTVVGQEGHSVIITGPRGSGKSSVVDYALNELRDRHGDAFLVVHLSGFFHSDPACAAKEIWRQIANQAGAGPLEHQQDRWDSSHADSLTKVLATLTQRETGSYEPELDYAFQVPRSVIFVLDEFDILAATARQTLLYNLFDVTQSSSAVPVAVIGLTTRVDVPEIFEKRVKSRFEYRFIRVPLAPSLGQMIVAVRNALTVDLPPKEISPGSQSHPRYVTGCTHDFYSRPSPSPSQPHPLESIWNTPHGRHVIQLWNHEVQALTSDASFIATFIEPPYYQAKSLRAILTSLIIPLSALESLSIIRSASWLFRKSCSDGSASRFVSLLPPLSNLSRLENLPALSLALLISATRLDALHDPAACNFNMAYREYQTLASRARSSDVSRGASGLSRVWSRPITRRAWELLIHQGLLLPMNSSQPTPSGRFHDPMGIALVRPDVTMEEIAEALPSMHWEMRNWCQLT